MGLYEILTQISSFLSELEKNGEMEAYKELNKIYSKLCRPMMHIGGDVPAACKECAAEMLEFRKKYGYTKLNILANELARFARKQ